MGEHNEPLNGELLEDLRRVDRPMDPSAAFDGRLRNELFDDGVAVGLDARATRRRSKVPAAMTAAAVVVTVVAAAVLLAGRDDRQDVVYGVNQDPAPAATVEPGLDTAAARTACQAFTAQAFGDLTQVQVAGPNNATYLPTLDAVVAAANRLDAAIVQLGDDLTAAGLRDPEFTAQSDRARRSLTKTLGFASEGRLPNAQEEMGQMDEHLEPMARALIQSGVTGCVL